MGMMMVLPSLGSKTSLPLGGTEGCMGMMMVLPSLGSKTSLPLGGTEGGDFA